MIRGTTPTFTYEWDGDVDISSLVDVCVSFYQKKTDHLLPLHSSEGRVIIAANGATVTLTQDETLAFEKGSAQCQLKLKFFDGTVWGSDLEKIEVDEVLHEEVW